MWKNGWQAGVAITVLVIGGQSTPGATRQFAVDEA
jgi:hypothetical protein